MPTSGRPDWRMLLLILAIAALIVFLGYTLDRWRGGGMEPPAPSDGTLVPR